MLTKTETQKSFTVRHTLITYNNINMLWFIRSNMSTCSFVY